MAVSPGTSAVACQVTEFLKFEKLYLNKSTYWLVLLNLNFAHFVNVDGNLPPIETKHADLVLSLFHQLNFLDRTNYFPAVHVIS